MSLYTIYKISFSGCNGCYIGITKDTHKRLSAHLAALRGNKHINKKLQRAFNHYGEHKLNHEILENVSQYERSRERFWIGKIGKENVFNKANGMSDRAIPTTVFQFLISDLSDMDVARIADTQSTQIVKRWRDGKEPSLKVMKNFATHFKKSIETLLSPHTERKGKQ